MRQVSHSDFMAALYTNESVNRPHITTSPSNITSPQTYLHYDRSLQVDSPSTLTPVPKIITNPKCPTVLQYRGPNSVSIPRPVKNYAQHPRELSIAISENA
eukprot:Tbor_TRINITY_DN5788_c6_g4::TRINITY_DN5788_c6_g4_i1::g.20656::m.20656